MKCRFADLGSVCLLLAGLTSPAGAATFTVTNAADAGPGSLRQAILEANGTPGADTIHFNYFNFKPGSGQDIHLTTALPEITAPVTIDVFTQPVDEPWASVLVYLPPDTDGLVIAATNCVVRGCYLVYGRNSVVLRATSRGAVIGGTDDQAANIFGYAAEAGIRIEGGSGHFIQGNQMYAADGPGVLVTGGSNCVLQGNILLNNRGDGVRIEGGVKCSLQSNEIVRNGGAGVAVTGGTNHSIRANFILGNAGLGIDLGGDGVTANDNDDPDTGPNHLQNFPTVSTATFSASGLTVSGSMNSRPNTAITLDFYSNASCDDSGYGEGQKHLGATTITTANNGDRNFSVTLTSAPVGRFVTATATDAAGNTSEFSPCVRFVSTMAPTTFTVTNVNDAGPGSLRQAILDSNARFANGTNTIVFNIPGTGVRRILLTSDVLPQITESVIIDGYTQPGSSVNTASIAFNGVLRIRLDGILLGFGRALDITAGNSTVRGLNIMNFANAAVACSGLGSNTISGNLIGITVDGEVGSTAWNDEAAVFLLASSQNVIGGTNSASRNVIAGYAASVSGRGDVLMENSSSNRVTGNFLGGDVTGTNVVWGGADGVHVRGDAYGNVIGGSTAGARNVLLGHYGSSIHLEQGAVGTVIQGNFIGVTADGIRAPEESPGAFLLAVYVEGTNTLVGGANNGAGNMIAGYLALASGTGNAVLRNSLRGHDRVGIDLGGDGPTLNDADDADAGANNLQNYPEILSAIRYPDRTLIRSRLQGISNATYRIDFYESDRLSPSGYAEARTWLGTTNVTIGGSGLTNFNWSASASLPAGHWVTATATDATNNTSELAPAAIVALSNAVNLVVSLAAPAEPVSRATNFTYTLEVRNLGPANAPGVVLSNFLPANVSFVSASTTQGSCAHAAGVVNCPLGVLTNGSLATVVLTVHADTNGLAELRARASANAPEADAADNVATGGPFAGLADIDVVSGGFSSDPVPVGQQYDTIVTITNLGPDSAFVRVEVTWTWPDTAVSITTTQGTVGVPASAAWSIADVGTVLPGRVSTITVRSLRTSEGSGGIFVNVIGDGFDPELNYFQGGPATGPGPGALTLDSPTLGVGESDGVATLRVARSGGAVGPVTVSYATSPGSATAGADYTPVSGTLTFGDGETEQSIMMPVLDDLQTECMETFTVSLFNPTGGATFLLFGNTNCVVQIGDNDPVLRGLVTGVSVTATNASATGNGYADSLTLSDDGRYVAFASSSTDLLAADVDEPPQVFVRDLTLGTTTRASVNRFGTNGADNGASQPRLARNGRYLAFVSTATDLSTNDTSTGYPQVYLRDSVGGTTLPVSLSNTGRPENEGVAANPLITSNGLGVAFQSTGLGLLGIVDANLANDVYFREVAAGMTHVVSVNRWGTATGNGESYLPEGFWFVGYRVHGRHIGFTSFASDLVAGDSNGTADVFVRDLTNGVTTLASVNRFGTGSGNGQSIAPLVSADGRYVLFLSSASDLVADDTNESTDVFVRDLVAGVTHLVSVNRFATGSGAGYSQHRGFSADGRYALFTSDASDLVPNDRNGADDVFVRDLVAGTTILVSANCDGTGAASGYSSNPSISPDGRFVAFTSDALDVVRGAGGNGHAYLRNLASGTTTLLSGNRQGGVSSSGGCSGTVVANGGATAAFQSTADDLMPIDENGSQDIFAWRAYGPGTSDLAVQQIDSPDFVPAGADVTYRIAVRNHGSTNATNVVLTDTLPPGATFVSATASQGSCSNLGRTVTCHLGPLAVDALATVQLVAQLAGSGFFTNTASVSASQPDPQTANNTSTEVTARTGLADLALRMSGTPIRVAVGQAKTFTLTVSNLGPHTAYGVVMTSGVPPDVNFSASSPSQGTVQINGLTAIWQVGSIPVLGAATLLLHAVPTAPGLFAYAATVSSFDMDPAQMNNSATNTIMVVSDWGRMSFSQSTYSTSEGAGPVVITVTRAGETDATVSVQYETTPESATDGADYTAVSGTLVFTHGETVKTFTVPIVDDGVFECLERFLVVLSNPTDGAVLAGEPSFATVIVADNDHRLPGFLLGVSVAATNPAATGNGPNPLYYFNGPPALSADGRYVAFASSAVNLVPGVPRNPVAFLQDVFVRDLQRGQSTLVSSGPYRWSGGAVSADVAFSADGRYVAFSALGQLTDQYSPAGGQIYVRDWRTGATRLASIGPNGTGGNTPSFSPSASSNGQVVAFTSPAVNLFAGPDTNANFDVFAWQAASGTAQLVSVNRAGTGTGNGRSLEPILSANGRLVAFSSEASDLVNNDTNGWQDVFVRDLVAGTTVLISVNQSGTSGGLGHSHNPVFSADGRYVAFTSTAGDLVPGDGNGTEDVFVRDLLLGTTRLVSVNEAGTGSGNSFSSRPSISADNRYVAFQSAASDLAPGNPSSLYNVFLRDLVSGTTTLVSTRCDGTRSGNALSWHPALSANGRYVAFTSLATDLTGDPVVPAVENVFRRDLLTGQTTLCSRSHTGVGGANLPSWPPSLSADGSTVAFLSDATNLLPLDGNEATDLFAWVAGPLPTALSAAQGGGTALITWLESGNNCVLLSATNPSAPAASWAPVTSGITDFGLVKVYAAHFAPGEPTRYYRLRCP